MLPEARALAKRLGSQPRMAFAGLKRAINEVHRDEIERAMTAETETIVRLMLDPETRVRVAAFGREERRSNA